MTETVVYMTEKGFLLESGHSVSWKVVAFRFLHPMSFKSYKSFKHLMLPGGIEAWCYFKGIRTGEFRKSFFKNIFCRKCIILSFGLKLEMISARDRKKAFDDGIGIFFCMFVAKQGSYNDITAWNCFEMKRVVNVKYCKWVRFTVWNSSQIENLSRYWTVHNLLLANHFPAPEDGHKLPQRNVADGHFVTLPVICHWLQVATDVPD